MSIARGELDFLLGKPLRIRRAPVSRAVSPLDDWMKASSPLLGMNPKAPGAQAIVAYCRYVGSLITASGVAAALRLTRHTAEVYLEEMTRRGQLRRGRIRHLAQRATVWEWVEG